MAEDIIKENKEEPIQNRIVGGYSGFYALSFSGKIYTIYFPVNNTLEENLAATTYIRDEVIKAIAAKDEQEKAKKEESRE
jgi:hypothetical protein